MHQGLGTLAHIESHLLLPPLLARWGSQLPASQLSVSQRTPELPLTLPTQQSLQLSTPVGA